MACGPVRKGTDVCMRKFLIALLVVIVGLSLAGCNTYKAKPLSFKTPTSYPNAQVVAGATVAAKAYSDAKEAKENFGFDVHGAGLLPVLVVFDNQGGTPLSINGQQTFLEDSEGNIWPVLADNLAYERVTKFADTNEMFKQGAKDGLLGAAAGALIGGAIGVVSGDSVAESVGKGAAVGAAAGATMGGASKYGSREASHEIINDLESKTLENKAIPGNGLAFGYIFFPGEAGSPVALRLKIQEANSVAEYSLRFGL